MQRSQPGIEQGFYMGSKCNVWVSYFKGSDCIRKALEHLTIGSSRAGEVGDKGGSLWENKKRNPTPFDFCHFIPRVSNKKYCFYNLPSTEPSTEKHIKRHTNMKQKSTKYRYGLKKDSMMSWTFFELPKLLPNLDPWTPHFMEKYVKTNRKIAKYFSR